jgi:hypothetical protein
MPSEADRDSTDTQDAPVERRRERPRKSKRPKPPIPQTEAEIDAPDKLTLTMLGVMGLVTIALWLFARSACNYHPPRETRRPRVVKLEELAREPKGAALEMQQRLLQYDFDGALQLASGDAAREVEKAKAACQANTSDCATKRKLSEKGVLSAAALLERSPAGSVVRVTSNTPSGKQVSIVRLERAGSIWKVTSRVPDDGSFKAKPSEPIQLTPMPAGSASGAAAASGAGPQLRLVPRTANPATTAPPAPAPAPTASQ